MRVDRERYGMREIERRKAYDRRRPLMLKLRVVPKRPMSKRQVLDAIDRSVETGVLDPAIEIHVADWAKATKTSKSSGSAVGSSRPAGCWPNCQSPVPVAASRQNTRY